MFLRYEAIALTVLALGWRELTARADVPSHVQNSSSQDSTLPQELIQHLKSPDAAARKRACGAQGRLGPRAAPAAEALLTLALHDTDFDARMAAMEALVAVGSPAVPPLVQTLKAKDKLPRLLAATVLGRMRFRARAAAIPLTEALGDSEIDVSNAAANALLKIRGKAATTALAGRLQDPKFIVQFQAAHILAQIGCRPAEVIPVLEPLLGEDNAFGRATAAEDLGNCASQYPCNEVNSQNSLAGMIRGHELPSAQVD